MSSGNIASMNLALASAQEGHQRTRPRAVCPARGHTALRVQSLPAQPVVAPPVRRIQASPIYSAGTHTRMAPSSRLPQTK
jgi:hypothetical protein